MTEEERRKRSEYFTPDDEISFSLIDKATVDRLRREGDIKLPPKKVSIPKDRAWNTKLMSSKLLQGIENGDSIPKISKSLMEVIGRNEVSAVRNARTMVTGAENVGRQDSYQDLKSQGVMQKKVWIATPDDRTRESHLAIDDEEVDIDAMFSNGCKFPGDPDCPNTSEVWNCRCTMRTHIIGFRRADGSVSQVSYDRDKTMHEAQIADEKMRRIDDSRKTEEEPKFTLKDVMKKPERPSRIHMEDFSTEAEYWEAREKYDVAWQEYKEEKEKYDAEVQRFVNESLPEKPMTLSEVQEWCNKHDIKIYGDISPVDCRALTLYTERMEKLSKDFPEVMTYREKLPIPKENQSYELSYQNRTDYIASADHGFTFGAVGRDAEYLLSEQARAISDGFRVMGDGTINQLFDHEFGHNVYDYLIYKNGYDPMSHEYAERRSAIEKDLISSCVGKDGISEYALTNDLELFAEGFSAWYGGENTEFANSFGDFLRRWL